MADPNGWQKIDSSPHEYRWEDDKVVYAREFWDAAAIRVEAGTTGPRGGDTGQGGSSVVRLRNMASMDWQVEVVAGVPGANGPNHREHPDELVITIGGDAELHVLAEALRYAALVLDRAGQPWGADEQATTG